MTRIEAFSVGAFAIATSLLVLEICLELAIRKGATPRPDADAPKDLTITSSHVAGDVIRRALHQARRKALAREQRCTKP
jgi:hypothetical protein